MLVTANIVVLLLLAASAAIGGYALDQLNSINRVKVSDLTKAPQQYVIIKGKRVRVASTSSPPFTVLLVGSDSRAGDNSGPNTGNASTNSENLSDSIILARVSPATHQAALLSIPRDLWVSIPGLGMAKINEAFAGGDPTRLIQVIEQDLGIPINHFAEVSFESFQQIANAIGGVPQYFPSAAYDHYSGLEVGQKGCVNLKGAEALAFVRSRHYYYVEPGEGAQPQEIPESDLGRIQRQQAFIKNAIEKIRRNGDLTNPVTLPSLVNSITKNLTVDNTFSDSQLISLAEDFSHINANSIPNTTYPVQNYVVDGADALSGLPEADAATVAQFEAVGTVAAGTEPGPVATSKKTGGKTGAKTGSTVTTPATATTVAHGTISVEVENGSGASNQATEASSDLESAGYVVSGSTDAATYDYTANVVEYGPDGLAAARTLQSSLAGGATLEADPSLTGSSLTLVTGSAWDGLGDDSHTTTTSPSSTTTVTVPPAAGTIYGSSATVEPDSSSYVHGVYIPPGREPGEAVQTCGD
jgi:LCP family protein required for cell wall assembly